MGSKIAPSWPQERPGSDAKSILVGLEVELLLGTIRPPTQDRVRDLCHPQLGLWEEGREEGKPSTHTVIRITITKKIQKRTATILPKNDKNS